MNTASIVSMIAGSVTNRGIASPPFVPTLAGLETQSRGVERPRSGRAVRVWRGVVTGWAARVR